MSMRYYKCYVELNNESKHWVIVTAFGSNGCNMKSYIYLAPEYMR